MYNAKQQKTKRDMTKQDRTKPKASKTALFGTTQDMQSKEVNTRWNTKI